MNSKNIVKIHNYWYNELDCLGKGTFGEVFKGHSEQDDTQLFAIKRMRKMPNQSDSIRQEIQILQELSEPGVENNNLLRLWNYIEDESHMYLVMEYCNGGDLDHYLRDIKKMDEPSLRIFLQQIGSGMKILYDHQVIHRDLKPANILLSYKGTREIANITFKIGDFGIGKFVDIGKSTDTFAGTPVFMAPELFANGGYDYKADLWSIGAIAYNCLTSTLYCRTTKSISLPGETSSDLNDLLTRLLCHDPKQRLSFMEFYNHRFIEMPKKMKQEISPAKITRQEISPETPKRSPSICCIPRRRKRTKPDKAENVISEDVPNAVSPEEIQLHNPIREVFPTRHSFVVRDRNVYGVSQLDTKIVVLCRTPSALLCYDQMSSYHSRSIDLTKNVKLPQDVAGCHVARCLYVTDIGTNSIWKVKVGYPAETTEWVTGISSPHTVSVGASSGQVVTFADQSSKKRLHVYGVDGLLVRSISLPGELRYPQHAVESGTGSFFVSFGDLGAKKHGVCEVSSKGKIVRYGQKSEKLTHPTHLALDTEGRLFVADNGNDRLLRLDGDLKINQILTRAGDAAIEKPFRLCYTSTKALLVFHSTNKISTLDTATQH